MRKGKLGKVLQNESGIILTSMALKRFFWDDNLGQHLDRSFQQRLNVRGYHSERRLRHPAYLYQSDRGGMRFFSLL
jgi:hypothetical protein